MKDFKSKKHDTNDQLTEKEIKIAINVGSIPFDACRITPLKLIDVHCPTLLIGEVGNNKHILYVRVTHNIDEEKNAGKIPRVLTRAAKKYGAIPHIIRVNISRNKDYYDFKYWGIEKVIKKIKSDIKNWNLSLLKGKSVNSFLNDKQQVNVFKFNYYSSILVDEKDITFECIDFIELVNSMRYSDEYYIFTCSCGIPECARITQGVTVVHDGEYILWMVPNRKDKYDYYIFNKTQYIREITAKISKFIKSNEMKAETQYDLGLYTGSYVQYIKKAFEDKDYIKPIIRYSYTSCVKEDDL